MTKLTDLCRLNLRRMTDGFAEYRGEVRMRIVPTVWAIQFLGLDCFF